MPLKINSKSLIDIHTHHTEGQKGVYSLLNVFLSDYPAIPVNQPITVGMHPWHLDSQSAAFTSRVLKTAASRPNVVALGETGLDKVIHTDMELQEKVFCMHIKVAEKLSKPLVIHCVKAFQELIAIKKKAGSSVPWIIHGYHGSKELTVELIKQGFYLSLNEWIMRNPEKGFTMLGFIPLNRLFLETDEFSDHIENLYQAVQEFYKKDIKAEIYRNFKETFGITKPEHAPSLAKSH